MPSDPVDIHVGRKLRSRRAILEMSQEELGDAVGITFQQIQKYERGLNRIGASRLHEFACILGIGVSYFFEGFDEEGTSDVFSFAIDDLSAECEGLDNKEVIALVTAYYNITDEHVRKRVLSLVKSLARDAEPGNDEEDPLDDQAEANLA